MTSVFDAAVEGALAHKAGLGLVHCPYSDEDPELREAWAGAWETRDEIVRRGAAARTHERIASGFSGPRTHADYTHPDD